MLEYQKHKLLADCYAFLKPDKALLDRYIQSLDEARNADAIDEKKFLFLRTHKVVLDSLMDITKGDYARFKSNTYLKVYDDIQSKSQMQYRDEVASHEQTREKLKNLEESFVNEKHKSDKEIDTLKNKIASMEERETKRLAQEKEHKIKKWSRIFIVPLIVIPYIIALTVIEVIKAQYSTISWKALLYVGILVLVSVIILPIGFTKGKKWCYNLARRTVEKKNTKKIINGNITHVLQCMSLTWYTKMHDYKKHTKCPNKHCTFIHSNTVQK